MLSYHLWGFLNINMSDNAWNSYDGVEMENDSEVWSVLNVNTTEKTQAEVLRREDMVMTPTRLTDMKQVPRAVVERDALCRDFLGAAGQQLSEHHKVGILMRMLPATVIDKLKW